ncbi:MAG TPA: DUF3977 family protein [Candidatus Doudnabacteria bacterium]|nr:DUF3977 family protein [Candidatus Doudnabacteria bacterium]
MKKVYAEFGLGNETIFSTEIEVGEEEYRIPKFVKPEHVQGYYVRIWVFKTVVVLATDSGFKISKKNKNKLKVLFGISGTKN